MALYLGSTKISGVGITNNNSTTIDSALDSTSTNAVQNAVITNALNNKLNISDYIIDDSLNSTSENPVQNKIIYPSLSNFIPAGTTLYVKTDGTGDFTSVTEVFNYLTGKWSNGNIVIDIGTGTFNISQTINVNGSYFNIPQMRIVGQGASNTIINQTDSATAFLVQNINVCNFEKLTIQKTTNGNNGIQVEANSVIQLLNTTIGNFSIGCDVTTASQCHVRTGTSIRDCATGFHVERTSRLYSDAGASMSFSNLSVAWKVTVGGMIATSMPVANITYTNVTNKCSQTVGTFTANGYIGGTLQN